MKCGGGGHGGNVTFLRKVGEQRHVFHEYRAMGPHILLSGALGQLIQLCRNDRER